MEKRDGKRPVNPDEKGFTSVNRNIMIFAFFLLLSFVFWYLNSLSKELDTTIRYPVSYSSLPDGKTLPQGLPSRLDIIVKGYGYSILRLKLTGSKHPVIIDFSEAGVCQDSLNKPEVHYIITAPLISKFNDQIPTDCRIMSVKPDTLFFTFSGK